jgi:hypothetical protein
VILHVLGQNSFLHLIAVFEELLNNIVAKDICHKLQGVGLYLAEDLVLLITICSLKFLLNKPRSMLIATKLNNVLIDVLVFMLSLGITHRELAPYL